MPGLDGLLALGMRLIFLGTGTSAGIPAIGCDCPVCTSSDPRDQRLRTAAALQFSDPAGNPRTILIDTSPDLRQQALRARLTRCDAVLFTHNHVDHTFGLDEVRRFNAVMQTPIDIFAEPHTMEHLRRVYQHIFERDRNVNDSFVATLIPHRLEPGRAFELFGLKITPVRLLHGRLPVVGFRFDRGSTAPPRKAGGWGQTAGTRGGRASSRGAIPPLFAQDEDLAEPAPAPAPDARVRSDAVGPSTEVGPSAIRGGGSGELTPETPSPRSQSVESDPAWGPLPLAYCTDVSGIPPESWPMLAGVRTLVLDALRHRRHPTHLTLGQAVGIAHEIGAEQTWFVHMAHELGHAATDAELPEGMSLAYDGLVLEAPGGPPAKHRSVEAPQRDGASDADDVNREGKVDGA